MDVVMPILCDVARNRTRRPIRELNPKAIVEVASVFDGIVDVLVIGKKVFRKVFQSRRSAVNSSICCYEKVTMQVCIQVAACLVLTYAVKAARRLKS
jgi:hypothetical protein